MTTDQSPQPANVPAIDVRDVSHTYAAARRNGKRQSADRAAANDENGRQNRPALDNINLTVAPGEMFGILGPNGGGKTTLFRIIATILRPTSGDVRVFGDDVRRNPAAVRSHLGVVFQSPAVDGQLTAEENLNHHGRLYGIARDDLRNRVEQGLKGVGLHERRHDRVAQFSGGMRRRLELAKAMLHGPRLLLLDEPAAALDPGARYELWRSLEQLRETGVTVLLTTHLLEAAERCNRIALIDRGRIVALDSPDNLKATIGGEVITIKATRDIDALCTDIADRFGPWPQGGEPVVARDEIHCEQANGAQLITRLQAAFPDRIQAVTVGRPTLEDVFMHLTQQTARFDQ